MEKNIGRKILKDRITQKAFSGKEKVSVRYLESCGCRYRKDGTKQYQTNKAGQERGNVGSVKAVKLFGACKCGGAEVPVWSKAFEAHQQKAVTKNKVIKNVSVKSGKSR